MRFEHWEDEIDVEEIGEILREFGRGLLLQNSAKLLYMLRGFFEGLRRYMALEIEHLASMLNQKRQHRDKLCSQARRNAVISGIKIVRRPSTTMTQCLLKFVNCRLTVSVVSPQQQQFQLETITSDFRIAKC